MPEWLQQILVGLTILALPFAFLAFAALVALAALYTGALLAEVWRRLARDTGDDDDWPPTAYG